MNRLLVSKDFAEDFVENLNEKSAPISFIYREKGKYIGIDNRSHIFQKKDFSSLKETTSWLESLYPQKIVEGKNNIPRIYEWMTIRNLMDTDLSSTETKKHAKIRHSLYKGENINAKLVKTIYDSSQDTMTYIFRTPATIKAHEPGYKPQKVDPSDDFKKIDNPGSEYEMMIQVLDFYKWLKETRPENLGKITWKEIKEVLDVAYVKIWCNCPSFHWFGHNYRASQFDASLYPTNIPDKKTRKRFGEYSILCKHLTNLLKSNAIQFFMPQMASAAQKALKARNLI